MAPNPKVSCLILTSEVFEKEIIHHVSAMLPDVQFLQSIPREPLEEPLIVFIDTEYHLFQHKALKKTGVFTNACTTFLVRTRFDERTWKYFQSQWHNVLIKPVSSSQLKVAVWLAVNQLKTLV